MTSALPFVSVIMPVRNEAACIAESVGAVLSQDYPSECMEVIVADGMSTDNTRDILGQLQTRHSNLRLVDNPGGIVPTGFNEALAHAGGELIIRVDGHTIIAPDYVRKCVEVLDTSGADNVGGRMEPISAGLIGQAVALATSSPFGVGGARFHYSNLEEWVDTVYLGAWRRDVFQRIGKFDEEMVRNQDDEFNYRLRSSGGKILLSPRIKSRYYNRSTLRSLWLQYFKYGYWKVRVMQKHPAQMRLRHFIPPAFVFGVMAMLLTSLISKAGGRALLVLVLAYLTATLGASFAAAIKKRPRLIPILLVIYPTLHVSYGAGFLAGLVRFRNRWRDQAKEYDDAENPDRQAEKAEQV